MEAGPKEMKIQPKEMKARRKETKAQPKETKGCFFFRERGGFSMGSPFIVPRIPAGCLGVAPN